MQGVGGVAYQALLELVHCWCRLGTVTLFGRFFVAGGLALVGLFGFLASQFGDLFHKQLFAHIQHLAALFYIFAAQNLVGYNGNALYHIANEPGTAYGVFAHFVEQQVGLEADEVDFVPLDILFNLFG